MSEAHDPDSMRRELVERLDEVLGQLQAHAKTAAVAGWTEPEQPGGERWEWEQIWAHLSEIIGYWLPEIRKVAAQGGEQPVPFGRVKSDAGRISYIEDHRQDPIASQLRRTIDACDELRTLILELPDPAWLAQGLHSARGVMSMYRILDEFAVGHLEEHERQLAALKDG